MLPGWSPSPSPLSPGHPAGRTVQLSSQVDTATRLSPTRRDELETLYATSRQGLPNPPRSFLPFVPRQPKAGRQGSEGRQNVWHGEAWVPA